jgi:hypothetical protein
MPHNLADPSGHIYHCLLRWRRNGCPTQNLIVSIRPELLYLFPPFGERPSAGADMCDWMSQTVKNAEQQTQPEIEQCKVNKTKVSHRLEHLNGRRMRTAAPIWSVCQTKGSAQNTFNQLAHHKKLIRQTQRGNAQLEATISRKLRTVSERKTKVAEKRNELIENKMRNANDVRKVTEDSSQRCPATQCCRVTTESRLDRQSES